VVILLGVLLVLRYHYGNECIIRINGKPRVKNVRRCRKLVSKRNVVVGLKEKLKKDKE